MSTVDIWTYRTGTTSTDISGFSVEARDGAIGKIDEATYETGAGWIVVDTGPWIFGKKVMLPAGTIERIDYDDECVLVNRDKDEIKHAPEFEVFRDDDAYREALGGYYSGTGF